MDKGKALRFTGPCWLVALLLVELEETGDVVCHRLFELGVVVVHVGDGNHHVLVHIVGVEPSVLRSVGNELEEVIADEELANEIVGAEEDIALIVKVCIEDVRGFLHGSILSCRFPYDVYNIKGCSAACQQHF